MTDGAAHYARSLDMRPPRTLCLRGSRPVVPGRDEPKERVEFRRGESARAAGRQIAEGERAEADADQADHLEAGGGAEEAHFALTAFREDDAQPAGVGRRVGGER